ncbi:hypothetical protein Godav_012368 [Gossypium davidsonii]|uniref:MADS-box domain-containing protein n=1 Tax=Gossypium davidsonii TaxID=34287 RepID=A0A7J8RD81_GOSDV|nr:hypothetical protein [Gossypium davidsonii]
MTRKKVKLAYITDDSAGKATYKKRTKGLMKKLSELSTLCDIDACSIMYNPMSPNLRVGLPPWETIPEMEKSKNMLNQESFLSQKTIKAAEQLKKHCKENWEKEMTQVMFNMISSKGVVHGLNFDALSEINLSVIIIALIPGCTATDEDDNASAMPRTGTKDIVQAYVNKMDPMQRHQWIMELMSNNNPQTHVGGDGMMFQSGENINPNNDL